MSVPFIPKFLVPDPDGQLSNSLTPTFKTRYSNSRGSADPCGQTQYIATRVGTSGVPAQRPLEVWRSGWLGTPTMTAMPRALRDFGCAQFNGRVYIAGGQDVAGNVYSEVWSAPLNGGSVGSWRREKYMTVRPGVSSGGTVIANRTGLAMTAATFGNTGGTGSVGKGQGGTSWLIIYGGVESYGSGIAVVATMIAAPILGDGVLGDWITLSAGGWGARAFAHLLAVPNQYMTACLVLSGGHGAVGGASQGNVYTTMVRNAPLSAQSGLDWDIPGGGMVASTTTGFPAVSGHTMAYDWANSMLLSFRGSDNVSANQLGWFYTGFGVDVFNWQLVNVGASWAAGSAAGAAHNNGAVVYFGAQSAGASGGSPKSYAYVIGGTSSATVGDAAAVTAGLTAIEIGTITWGASTPSATWATSAQPLAAGGDGCRAALSEHSLTTDYGYPPWTDPNRASVTVLGGGNSVNASLTRAVTNTLLAVAGSGAWTTSGGDFQGAWLSGQGAGLASADLGAGGIVAASAAGDAPAGSQDMTVVYGNAGGPAGALAKGDQVVVSVQQSDKVSGDVSSIRSAILRIGDPPTISNLAVSSLTTMQPVVSLAFNAGNGGGSEASWRIRVTRNSDSVLMFDSGVKIDQQNSVQVQLAPGLANVAYTAQADVSATDNPVAGSTDTATQTLIFTPTLAAAVGVPSSVSATGDAAGKWALLTGTAAASTTGLRIYYRRNGSGGALQLYADNVAASAGAFSFKLMDRLALGVLYDFAVSALGGTAQTESAQSSVVTATIPADSASPSGYLHLAGQPLTGALGVSVQLQGWPKASTVYASKLIPLFNAARPIGKQGVLNYRTWEFEFMSIRGANLSALELLVNQLLLGAVVFWRDRRGTMFTGALNSPQDINFIYPDHTGLTLRLVQVADTYSPYLSNGSAIGIPALSYGTLLPPTGGSSELVT